MYILYYARPDVTKYNSKLIISLCLYFVGYCALTIKKKKHRQSASECCGALRDECVTVMSCRRLTDDEASASARPTLFYFTRPTFSNCRKNYRNSYATPPVVIQRSRKLIVCCIVFARTDLLPFKSYANLYSPQ